MNEAMHERHSTYLLNLIQRLRRLTATLTTRHRLEVTCGAFVAFALLDLESTRPLLESCYRTLTTPSRGGKPPRDPVAMLRALILMAYRGHPTPHRLVAELKARPELAILAGFDPADLPGPSTFYDFIDRLADGPYHAPCRHYTPPSKRRRAHRGRFVRQLKDERAQANALTQAELARTTESRTQFLARRALATLQQRLPDDFAVRVNHLLTLAAVAPSVARGALSDDAAQGAATLDISADGSLFETSASSQGQKVCQCGGSCDCARAYSDPTAQWGWDSHRKRWVFGHRAHVISTTVRGRDLPLHLSVHPANTNDVVMGIDDLVRFEKRRRASLPDALKLAHGLFDAGYDATAFYRLNLALDIKPVIALARPASSSNEGVELDSDGVPLCVGGARMKRHNFNAATGKVCWHCPAKYAGREQGKQVRKVDLGRCPLGVLCEPETKMGPLVHLSVEDDPRLSGPVTRGTERWKALYKKRSGAERVFASFKHRGPQGRVKRQEHLLVNLMGQSIVKHALVWAQEHLKAHPVNDADALIEVIEELARGSTQGAVG